MTNRYIIIFPYDGGCFGGSHVSSLMVARWLKARGHRPIVVSHGQGRVSDVAREAGLETIELPPLKRRADRTGLHYLPAMTEARRVLRRSGAAFVHANDIGILRLWSLPCLLEARRMIAHWRSNYSPSLSVNASLRLARSVITVSEFSRRQLPRRCRQVATVLYEPILPPWSPTECRNAREAVRNELGLTENHILLGIFGSLKARKRTWLLADIVAALPQLRGKQVFGLHCGERSAPPDEQFEKKIEALGIRDRIRRLGFVSPAQRWMCACDVLLMPALNEPCGRTPFEAMGVGVPVVISKESGNAELIQHDCSGMLVSGTDVDAWISAIDRALEHSTVLAERGREIVQRLGIDRHCQEIELAYERAMRRSAGWRTLIFG